jgi:hypothetical protein
MPASKRKNALDPNSTVGVVREMVPDTSFRAVTKSDTVNIASGPARALYVGGAGNLVAINENDVAVTFVAVPAGTILPIATKRVNSTNTTATNIVAL